jgi:hypothetical protein
LSLDDLVVVIADAEIKGNEAFNSTEPIERQHEWAAVQSAAFEELLPRGDDAMRRLIPLLASPHPAVRLTAALVTRKLEPALAIPALQDLENGTYGLLIFMNAQRTINAMRKRGELPPQVE